MLFVALPTGAGHVEVQHEQLGLLGAVARAHRAYQLGGRGPDAPHDAPRAARAQLHEVAYELAGAHVPQFHGAVVRRRDDEAVARLQAGYRRLVLVGACKGLYNNAL